MPGQNELRCHRIGYSLSHPGASSHQEGRHELPVCLRAPIEREVLQPECHHLVKALGGCGLADRLVEAVDHQRWHALGPAVLGARSVERTVLVAVKAEGLGNVDADGAARHACLPRCRHVRRPVGRTLALIVDEDCSACGERFDAQLQALVSRLQRVTIHAHVRAECAPM
eukprot:996225-Prymnesium_polylepis.1